MEPPVWISPGDTTVPVYQDSRESTVILVSYSWRIELTYRLIISHRKKKHVKDKFSIVIYKEMIIMFKKVMTCLNLFKD